MKIYIGGDDFPWGADSVDVQTLDHLEIEHSGSTTLLDLVRASVGHSPSHSRRIAPENRTDEWFDSPAGYDVRAYGRAFVVFVDPKSPSEYLMPRQEKFAVDDDGRAIWIEERVYGETTIGDLRRAAERLLFDSETDNRIVVVYTSPMGNGVFLQWADWLTVMRDAADFFAAAGGAVVFGAALKRGIERFARFLSRSEDELQSKGVDIPTESILLIERKKQWRVSELAELYGCDPADGLEDLLTGLGHTAEGSDESRIFIRGSDDAISAYVDRIWDIYDERARGDDS